MGQTYNSNEASIYPVINGQLLAYQPYNVFKPGYKVRFNLTTIASLFNKEDYIDIKPTFYWVPKSILFPSTPQPVKVYYDEKIAGTNRSLVEVGSEMDKTNIHQLCIGDPELDVDYRNLIDSANKQGYDAPKDLISLVADSWTYGHVKFPGNVKVSEGKLNSSLLSLATDGTYLGLGTVDDLRLNNCLQNWYGEYYMPNSIHVRLDTPAAEAKFNADAKAGYDFKEDYWCNSGYLLINFEITSYKMGNPHL